MRSLPLMEAGTDLQAVWDLLWRSAAIDVDLQACPLVTVILRRGPAAPACATGREPSGGRRRAGRFSERASFTVLSSELSHVGGEQSSIG